MVMVVCLLSSHNALTGVFVKPQTVVLPLRYTI